MADVGAIEKGRKNAQQGYSFRGIDDAYAAFQPLFVRHGMFVIPTVLKSTREERATKSGGTMTYTTLEVRHTFYAEDGSSLDAITVGEAMDSGDKSSNKAMSAAMKYALLEVFCVPTEGDNDTENHSPEPLPMAAAAPPARRDSPTRPTPPKLATAEQRARMIQRLLEAGFTAKQLQEFAVKTGLILSTESAETDWPLDKAATDKASMAAILASVKKFLAGEADDVPM